MPSCYVCKDTFISVKALIVHLRLIHCFTDSSKFQCGENKCFRDFSSVDSYRKHLNKKHDNISVDISESSNISSASINNSNSVVDLNSNHFPQFRIEGEQNPIVNVVQNDISNSLNTNLLDISDKFSKEMNHRTLIFITKMYADSTLTRKQVQSVINSIDILLKEPLEMFEEFLLNFLNKYNIEKNDEEFLINFSSKLQNLFLGYSTEHQRFKVMETLNVFIPPEEFVVGQRFDGIKNRSVTPISYKAQHIPISKILTAFFHLPNILLETLKYLEELDLEKHHVSNVLQTEFWKRKKNNSFEKKSVVLPLFIFFDEYECGNPLGSHSGIHKLGAVYFSLPFLPIEYKSRLENIFLTLLFHSSDLKQFGNKIIFSKLIDECNDLEEHGITLNISEKVYKVYFCPLLFLGDNLGLNTMLGFTQSFRSTFFCRFCKCSRTETENQVKEATNFMRTRYNYQLDVNSNKVNETGIKEECVFNDIHSFHVTENFAVDIAHDIFEGVAMYDITELLYQYLIVDKLFSIDMVNDRIKYFNYGRESNKPPLLTLDNIKKKKLKMSCAETKCLILYFGLILGPIVPIGNKFWDIYILLREMLDIILLDAIVATSYESLRDLIAKHHTLFLSLFDTTLKPKYHILVHYPFIMKQVGPLKYLSSLRYESKHRESKLSANVIASRVNITQSLSIKHQLKLAHRFASKRGIFKSLVFKDTESIQSLPEILPDFDDINRNGVMNIFKYDVNIYKKIEIDNHIYSVGDIICVGNEKFPLFGKINLIVKNDSDVVGFIYDQYETKKFNGHLYAYEICTNICIKKCILHCNLTFVSSLVISAIDEKKYIPLYLTYPS